METTIDHRRGRAKAIVSWLRHPRKSVSGCSLDCYSAPFCIERLRIAAAAVARSGKEAQKKRSNVRENKSVAVNPIGVLWVEGHELVEENVGHRGHAHRGARMAGIGLGRGIDLLGTHKISN